MPVSQNKPRSPLARPKASSSRAPATAPAMPTTRELVIDACRELFNARGPMTVTTAEIAAEVGINEGNLYYYFKRKEDILLTLFERFESDLITVASMAAVDLQSEHPFAPYQRAWMELMWTWRFFFRDSAAVFALAPSLRPRLVKLSDSGQASFRAAVAALVRTGRLRGTEEQLDRLCVNCWIVAAYWIDYLGACHGIERLQRKHLDQGYAQVQALFEPYAVHPAVRR
jgi:AcrR family transcriptional regulator